jgi:recombination protein RecA
MTEQHRQRTIRSKLANMTASADDFISTGLAFGPLPRGAITELYGPSGCGKTSVALSLVFHCQQGGLSAAWIDADHTFDPAYASAFGIALEKLPVAQPDSAEQAFAIMQQLALSGALDLLVVDSAAALVPALELETALGGSGPGLQSRVLSSGLRKLSQALVRSRAAALFLNQTRTRAGDEESTAGGPSLRLYAAVRIALEPASVPGCARFRVLKNKAGQPFREGQVQWNSAPAGS